MELSDKIEEIKNRVSIVDILVSYGIYPTIKRKYLCCFHKDKHPSASIDKGIFFCFTCGKGWDQVDFVAEIEKCTKGKAVKIIDEKFGLGLYKPLNKEEKQELKKKELAREKVKRQKKWLDNFEREILNQICKEMRSYENLKQVSSVTVGAYKGYAEWKLKDCFFFAIEKIEWLDWLFDVIMEVPHPECEYDFVYGTNKKKILKQIWNLEITI